MATAPSTQAAPFTAYGLRQESEFCWQLIEPLPTEQAALEAELEHVDAKLKALADGTDSDYVKGCAILKTQQQESEFQARARYERLEASVTMLWNHECEQARTRHTTRCEQLKFDMGEEIQREINRLQRARDGVAVMDRRRMTRKSGTNSSTSSQGNTACGPGDAGSGGYDTSGNGDGSMGGNPVTEKRRMEVLLSATPIFRQLDKKLPSEDVDADLEVIKETMPTFLCDDAATSVDAEDDETDEEEEQESAELRNQIGGNTFKRRRLMYSADRVPEGLEVVVYRAGSTPAKKHSSGKSRKGACDDSENQRREIAAGVITAATSTQVYLLQTDGSFQTIQVDDWKTGRISVHTVNKTTKE